MPHERSDIDVLGETRHDQPDLTRRTISDEDARRLVMAKWGLKCRSKITWRDGVYCFTDLIRGGYVFDDRILSDDEREGLHLLGYEPESVLTAARDLSP